jgi:hypothetical protein
VVRHVARVSTGIIFYDKIDRQMPSAVKTADGNANEPSCERGITVSKLVRSAIVTRARKVVHLCGELREFFDASVNPSPSREALVGPATSIPR